jgi:integrase
MKHITQSGLIENAHEEQHSKNSWSRSIGFRRTPRARRDFPMNGAVLGSVFCPVEVEVLIAAAPCPWWRSMIQLGVSMGLRTTEALWLAWSDFDFAAGAATVACEPVPSTVGGDDIPRPSLALHRRRIVPLTAAAIAALTELRDQGAPGSMVFIPNWKIDQLWLDIHADHSLRPDRIAPGLYDYFRYIQRCARLRLARRLGIELTEVRWPYRPLSALRNTYAVTLASETRPAELAAHLGVARIRDVLGYFEIAAAATGGEP